MANANKNGLWEWIIIVGRKRRKLVVKREECEVVYSGGKEEMSRIKLFSFKRTRKKKEGEGEGRRNKKLVNPQTPRHDQDRDHQKEGREE